MSNLVIRPATTNDADVLSRLSAQLGYAATPDEIAQRLASISKRLDHAVFVAEDGVPIAWIDLHTDESLVAGRTVQVAGLVVDHEYRGRGIGKLLMAHAEQWARDRGCKSVRLRSNIIRDNAHAFYEKLGYKVIKTQKAFAKDLDSSSS